MKKLLAWAVLAFFAISTIPADALARGSKGSTTSVRGYTKKDGTRVQPHKRTTPDKSKNNNWSSKGNVNPYTGKKGTK